MNIDESQLPVYPSRILNLEDLPNLKIEDYKEDCNDIVERLKWKVKMIWWSWSNIISQKEITDKLLFTDNDSYDVEKLKTIIITFLDRIGQILSNTELLSELSYGMEKLDLPQEIDLGDYGPKPSQ